MSDEIKNSEKKSKSIMRNTKAVRYSKNLMFVAGAMGVTTGALLANTPKAEPNKKNKDENLKNTVDETQFMLKNMRNRNKMYIRGANLELIQLMEQGDQVVKSPWRSWQFGMNFFSNADIISGDGYGDKQEKYTYNSLYFRNNWKMKNALVSDDSIGVTGLPITPGNESQVSWRTANGNIYSGMNFDTSKGSSVNGEVRWGLVELRDIHEPLNEVEILARISPKEVKKESVSLNVAQPAVEPVGAPKIEPNITPPLEAPKINIPSVTVDITPNEPSVTVNVTPPTITALSISTPGSVGAINVTTPEVKAVDFILPKAGLSSDKNNRNFQNKDYNKNLNGTTINVDRIDTTKNPPEGNYISTWGYSKNLDGVNVNVNVNIDDSRAFMIDEGIDERNTDYKPFRYIGTINLNKSRNVGIDVQGTHTSYGGGNVNNSYPNTNYNDIKVVANIKVTNAGTIIGNSGTDIENQVAFGFNNFDASANNTRTEMINVGKVTLNAPKSAGIQLRPENPNSDSNNKRGLNMMTARNEKEKDPNEITGTININSYGSFGMLTVKNKDATTSRNYNTNDYKTKTLEGGQFANRAQVENMSFMKNTGEINIDGDSSIGVGHLHNIQAVYVGGTINIGKNNPNSLGYANVATNDISKTEGAVGVYTSVETRPVLKNNYDDHGLQNTTGATVGTETVEVFGTINLEQYAKGSIGLYAKDKGSITLKDNDAVTTTSTDENVKVNINKGIGIINVGGENNYGAVVDTIAYKSKQKKAKDQYETESSTDDKIGRIDLEEKTEINVTGKESIGYVLKKGEGSNSGTIKVIGNIGNVAGTPFKGSLGFYGEKGTFTNEKKGTISSSGNYAHAVALAGDTTGITFNNKGKIIAEGAGNIGVYADGKYTFNHSGDDAVINAGTDTVGIYAKNKDGILNIKAPINIADSSGTGTTIGIYSDGEAQVNFGENSNLRIGEGAVGLYSEDAAKFNNTFEIESGKTLGVELGKNSTFGLLNGNNTDTDSPLLSNYLVSRTTNGNINITSFDEGASLFYATSKAKAVLDEDYTIGNGGAPKTSVLVANNGSRVEIANRIKLTTNTNVGLIATKGTGTGTAASTAQNNGTIVSTRGSGIGIYTNESTGNSTGIITMEEGSSVGILGEKNSTLTNSGKIKVSKAGSAGIYGKDSDITNSGTGTDKGIYVEEGSSAGIFGVVSGTVPKTITNAGDIITKATESAGIYGKVTSAGNKLTIAHTGNITVNGNKSVGIYAKNESGTVANLVIDNTITTGGATTKGTININNEKSVGIYATNSTVSGLGKVILKDAAEADGSIAIYGSDGSKITSDNGDISLGKASQKRVAYYIKDTSTELKGTNIGKVSGYGVGVYLDGSNLNHTNAPTLDYTAGTDKGNGLIGLYLKNTTDISNYTNNIIVGNTVEDNGTNTKYYAIGIYADRQGTAANKYEIKAPITTGANGIGIFVGKDDNSNTGSSIKYSGTMSIGDETTFSGTGIYIADKPGTGDNEATLGSTSHIMLKGTNGVGVIIGKESKLSVESGATSRATIELIGDANIKGVGIYGLKGSQITGLDGLIFENHGKTAEMVRTVEGQANIANTNANPGIVVTHVINGETSLAALATISTPANSYNNIGLMAQGTKNPNMTWVKGDYEIVNDGTIDFSHSRTSTGIYAESARAQLGALGKIMLGEKSTGIYGVYNSDSPKYEGAPSDPDHNPNKLTVETTANSEIELGEESVGVYLKNASTGINLDGKIKSSAGATKNVGVYMINEDGGQADQGKKLEGMVNGPNAEITLGDGSVGLYSKGKAPNAINTVINKGKITVGKKIAGAPSVPSVGIYAENTNLITVASTSGPSSDITVGEDGIAFYGKHSDITAKGRVNFNNKGVLAYLENSNFVSYLGDISPTQNTMLYLKNSTAKMDGAGAPDDMPVNMTVADGYTGAYIEGTSSLTGVKTINLGRNSNGIFLQNENVQNANFDSTGIAEIVGTQANAKGILGINTSLLNNTKISLSGDNSIGIYSSADSTKTVVNKGKLELSGKKTLGVFLKGSQSFENKADISIADSADAQNPTIGVYTSNGTSPITLTSGNIEVGVKSIGVYSTTNSPVNMTGGNLHVKDEGMGIYKQDGSVSVAGNIVVDSHTATTPNTEPVGVYAVNGATVNDSANVTVGEKSYGFILSNNNSSKVNVYTNTAGSNVTLGSDSTYLYSGGRAQITNNKDIAAGNVDRVIGFYVKGNNTGGGNFVNNGLLDFSTGKGNIAVYAPGSKATNSASGKIYVGATDYTDPLTGQIYSDKSKIVYGIGMATDNGGHIANEGEIRIFGDKSIGMYGSGAGTVVENRGNILLDGSRATASNKIESMTGVYVDEGATFINEGIIRTADAYAGREGKVNENVNGLVGVAVMNGSTLVNEKDAKILIDADNSYGVVIRGKKNADGTVQRYATIKNYGEISVRGRGTYGINWKDITRAELEDLENQINSKIKSDAKGQEIRQTSGTDKEFEGIKISIKNGEPVFTKDGVPVSDDEIVEISKLIGNQSNIGLSDIGFYVDTLGRTKPIDIDGSIPPINSQLIIGTEYSEMTNSKYWVVKGDVIKPFLDQITGRNFKLTSLAGSLTWMATPVLNSYGEITGVAMAKVPYTSYVKTTDNAWNFTDGLEQRYGVNSLDSREKVLFNKLNSIGKNEKVLLTQAFDEMMGHQYANVQQRTYGTGRLIDKEINHLSKEWETKSKQSNKIKVFGMKDEYTTDTAGIIDYTSNAYGFAYLHEDETVKLGNVSGWYAGGVHNKFKFKDIGGSRENQTMLKLGIFKTMTPASDHNGNLQWTVSGEGYVSKNDMHRKYLVVDEIFNAKSEYTTYGVAVKNEVGYNIRTSERTSIRPYGSLKVEYGRFSDIKEKSGEVRLDVQGNDYYSVKPEIGVEFKYRQPFAVKSIFTASLGLGYENELGKVGNVNNKARVSYTSADWFNIRGDKDSRKGKFKADLNFGIENSRVGMTLNTGYDSDNNNLRGGLGFRLIY